MSMKNGWVGSSEFQISDESWQLFTYMSGSRARIRVLARAAAEPVSIRDLTDVLSIPRSTVQRNVTSLEDYGLAVRRDGAVRATSVGKHVLSVTKRVLNHIATADRLFPLFGVWVGDGEHKLSPEVLSDAEVYLTQGDHPYAPESNLQSILRGKREVRGVWHKEALPFLETISDNETAPSFDLLITTGCGPRVDVEPNLEGRESRLNPDEFGQLKQQTGGLLILNESVALLAFDETSRIQAVAISESDAVTAWAESRLDYFRERCTSNGNLTSVSE